MHARKTGAMIRASAVAGATMAGAPDDEISAIDRYAREIGLAFQIVDDILDVEGASVALGKTAGQGCRRRQADVSRVVWSRAFARARPGVPGSRARRACGRRS